MTQPILQPTTMQRILYQGNAFQVRQQLQLLDDHGRWQAYTGGTPQVALSLHPDGSTPVVGPLNASYNHVHELVAVIPSATIDAALSAQPDGTLVYLLVTAGLTHDYRAITPLVWRHVRYVG